MNLLFILPQQHYRIGHVPLLAVPGIAKGSVRQQPVQGFGDLPLTFGRKVDGHLIAIHQLEIQGTTAAELQAEGQAFSHHGVNPDNVPRPALQQIHQARAACSVFLQERKDKPDTQYRTGQPKKGDNDI